MDENLVIICWCYVINCTLKHMTDKKFSGRPLPPTAAKVEILEPPLTEETSSDAAAVSPLAQRRFILYGYVYYRTLIRSRMPEVETTGHAATQRYHISIPAPFQNHSLGGSTINMPLSNCRRPRLYRFTAR